MVFSDPVSNLAKLSLTEGMKVADLGAGSGFYSFEAAKRIGASGRVYSIDVQKNLLERLRSVGKTQGLTNIEVIWGDMERVGGTKLKDGSVDRAVSSNVLFQVSKRDEYALEVKRILKPGGKLLLIDWSELSEIGPKNIVTAKEAQVLFEKNGFKLDQSFSAGAHHYGLIFSRI